MGSCPILVYCWIYKQNDFMIFYNFLLDLALSLGWLLTANAGFFVLKDIAEEVQQRLVGRYSWSTPIFSASEGSELKWSSCELVNGLSLELVLEEGCWRSLGKVQYCSSKFTGGVHQVDTLGGSSPQHTLHRWTASCFINHEAEHFPICE